MRASGAARPKPLVEVAGATLLERNLFHVLGAGLTDVVVSVPGGIAEVGDHARARGAQLVESAGGRFEVFVEPVPLGNIGCAAAFDGRADAVLVVYADNLTTLDLGAVLDHHKRSGAALTLAAHVHPYRLPYGQLEVGDGEIVGYLEKPVWRPLVCSAVSVLGATALRALSGLAGNPPGSAVGLVELFHAVRAAGAKVAAFEHAAAWIDVNEASTVPSAEALVAAHPEHFEQWWASPVLEVPVAVDGPSKEVGVVVDDVADGHPVRYTVTGGGRGRPAPPEVAARAAFHLYRS